jgi:hypothetical protein
VQFSRTERPARPPRVSSGARSTLSDAL